jgi:putative flippase GtrA
MFLKLLLYFKIHFWQLVRFIIVGLVAFLLYFILIYIFYGKFALDYRMAATYAYFITVIVHFTLNRKFTYNQKSNSIFPDSAKYCIMLTANYLITLAVTTGTVELLMLTPYHGAIISSFATALSSFLLMKYFVFAPQESFK